MNRLQQIAAEPYESRGILHSEIALVIWTCEKLGIERLVESGRARAQSTTLLAKYAPQLLIYSIEMRDGPDERYGKNRIQFLPNVIAYDGDGRKMVPEIAAQMHRPTGILLDGPKGETAVKVLQECFANPQVKVGFIHDMRKLDHGAPSQHRAAAVSAFPQHKFSDDASLVARSSWMDANALKAGGPCGPQHEAQFGSYGPTLGVFFNPQQ
jgi:hypothetical protein